MPKINYRDASPPPPPANRLRAFFEDRPQLPYLLPFMAFVALMAPATFGDLGILPNFPWKQTWHDWHPFIYAAKTIFAAILLWIFWKSYTPIRWTHLPMGVLAGLFGTVLWIGTEYLCQHLGLSRIPDPAKFYNPDLELHSNAARWAYLAIRVTGPTLVVPIFEELFFRDFLMRAFIRGARYDDVPIGAFTWFSLLGTSLLFGINHGSQWPEGILYGLLMGILVIRTKSLGACILAHATTNLTLYLYVIYTADWQFM